MTRRRRRKLNGEYSPQRVRTAEKTKDDVTMTYRLLTASTDVLGRGDVKQGAHPMVASVTEGIVNLGGHSSCRQTLGSSPRQDSEFPRRK